MRQNALLGLLPYASHATNKKALPCDRADSVKVALAWGLLGRGYDGNSSTLLRALDGEHHFAGDLGKQGVTLAHDDVVAGVEFSAALAHDDAARVDQLAAVALPAP